MKSQGFSICALGVKCLIFDRSPIPPLGFLHASECYLYCSLLFSKGGLSLSG